VAHPEDNLTLYAGTVAHSENILEHSMDIIIQSENFVYSSNRNCGFICG
jgi:hypothetical protein